MRCPPPPLPREGGGPPSFLVHELINLSLESAPSLQDVPALPAAGSDQPGGLGALPAARRRRQGHGRRGHLRRVRSARSPGARRLHHRQRYRDKNDPRNSLLHFTMHHTAHESSEAAIITGDSLFCSSRRENQEVLDLGLLVVAVDVRAERHRRERVPRAQLEQGEEGVGGMLMVDRAQWGFSSSKICFFRRHSLWTRRGRRWASGS